MSLLVEYGYPSADERHTHAVWIYQTEHGALPRVCVDRKVVPPHEWADRPELATGFRQFQEIDLAALKAAAPKPKRTKK